MTGAAQQHMHISNTMTQEQKTRLAHTIAC